MISAEIVLFLFYKTEGSNIAQNLHIRLKEIREREKKESFNCLAKRSKNIQTVDIYFLSFLVKKDTFIHFI